MFAGVGVSSISIIIYLGNFIEVFRTFSQQLLSLNFIKNLVTSSSIFKTSLLRRIFNDAVTTSDLVARFDHDVHKTL